MCLVIYTYRHINEMDGGIVIYWSLPTVGRWTFVSQTTYTVFKSSKSNLFFGNYLYFIFTCTSKSNLLHVITVECRCVWHVFSWCPDQAFQISLFPLTKRWVFTSQSVLALASFSCYDATKYHSRNFVWRFFYMSFPFQTWSI